MTSQYWHKNILPEDVALAENAYKEATKYPLISSAKFDENTGMVESQWSYTDVSDLSGKKKYVITSTIQEPIQNSRYIRKLGTYLFCDFFFLFYQ